MKNKPITEYTNEELISNEKKAKAITRYANGLYLSLILKYNIFNFKAWI